MIVNYDGDVHKDYYYWVEAEAPVVTTPATPAETGPCQCPRHKQTAGRSLLAEVEEMERAAADREAVEWAEYAAAADAERLAWWQSLTPAEQDAHIDELEAQDAVWGRA